MRRVQCTAMMQLKHCRSLHVPLPPALVAVFSSEADSNARPLLDQRVLLSLNVKRHTSTGEQGDFNTSRQSSTSCLGRKNYRNTPFTIHLNRMQNARHVSQTNLVRRRFLPPCSPKVHRRCRLSALRAVLGCCEEFGLPLVCARTCLFITAETPGPLGPSFALATSS